MQQSVDIPQEDFDDIQDVDPTQEEMEEVALRALGRMTLQELINDSIIALVEVYKARPESFTYDAAHYNDEDVNNYTPFMDLIQYLQDMKVDESPRNTNL